MARTTLVLLPGLDGTEIFFGPLLEVLPTWVNPVAVTYPTSGANDYSDLLDVVQAAVGNFENFYVLGWSFSGPLALMLAAKMGSRVRGVILCASFIQPPFPGLSSLRFAVRSPTMSLVRLAHRATMSWSRYSTDMFRRDKAATWARVPSNILAARVRGILARDARDCLRGCPQPILYLAGSRDRVVPTWNAKQMVRELPSTKVVTIEGPHLALYTNPTAAVRAIVKFVKDTEAACRVHPSESV